MDNWVYYNGKRTNDFDILAGWFQELKKENERLKEANEQHRDDYIRLKNGYDEFKQRNRDLEEENKNLKAEKSKTEEVLKRYCGDSVDAPISTMVGLIIDDYFYQKAETENQVRELQKAEKTIDKLNKELVEYADKVDKLEKCACSIPTFPTLAEKINDMTCRYHMPVTPLDRRKARTEDIFQCVQELAEYANKQRKHIYTQDSTIASQTERINVLEEKLKNWEKRLWDPEWCRLIDKLNEIINKEAPIPRQLMKVYTNAEDEIWYKLDYLDRALCMRNILNDVKNKRIRELENKVNDLDVTNRKLKLENEKLIHVQGDNAIEHATEIIVLKGEIADLKKAVNSALEDVKKYKQRYNMALVSHFSYYGMGSDAEIHKLREENNKLKDALEFCQREASFAREHAHNVEVNAERIRKGLD